MTKNEREIKDTFRMLEKCFLKSKTLKAFIRNSNWLFFNCSLSPETFVKLRDSVFKI